jgi:hypothetical protein
VPLVRRWYINIPHVRQHFFFSLALDHLSEESPTVMSTTTQSIALPEDRTLESNSQAERSSNDRSDSILDSDSSPQQEFSLPQADGGLKAWLFLAGCFTIEALVWGE